MLLRITHFFLGHPWILHSKCEIKPKLSVMADYTRDGYIETHGGTIYDYTCRCGARKTMKFVGQRLSSEEIAALERMAK